jgi:hypothetical protein
MRDGRFQRRVKRNPGRDQLTGAAFMRVPVDEVGGGGGNDFPVPVSLSLFTVASLFLFLFFHRIRKLLSPKSVSLKTVHNRLCTSVVKSRQIGIYN